MPDVKQTIMDPGYISTPNTYGQRNDTNLESAYPNSPRWGPTGQADQVATNNFNKVLTETATVGLGVNNFDPNYSKSPKISEIVEVLDDNGSLIPVGEGGGAPTNPYVPPLTSPGEGNFNASQQVPFNGTVIFDGQEFGSGKGINNDPSDTSAAIAAYKIGDTLTKGSSE